MARGNTQKSLGWTILAIIVAFAIKFYQDSDGKIPSFPSATISLPGAEISEIADRFSSVEALDNDWEELKNCRLSKGRNNSDGDSFHVDHDQGKTEFRLYFVDAPESEYKTYGGGANNGKRLDEQGNYFGNADREHAAEIGKKAKKFTLDLLKKKPFKIRTKWEDVYDPGRQYCLVVVEIEGREVYLHELLVANGLARIHTRGADLPSGRDWRAQKKYLQTLEAEAKKKSYGGWGKLNLN